MSEKGNEIQSNIKDYDGLVMDNIYNLENASMALNELLDTYQWDYEPSAYDAIKYGNTVGSKLEKCTKEEKHSWEYITDYKKIMWLISVARDYCYLALTDFENAYAGGAANE